MKYKYFLHAGNMTIKKVLAGDPKDFLLYRTEDERLVEMRYAKVRRDWWSMRGRSNPMEYLVPISEEELALLVLSDKIDPDILE